MSYSLGEIQALSIKAARGAGLSWGEAEDAGYAVRWLCQNGNAGCELLVEVLEKMDTKSRANTALLAGIRLMDRAKALEGQAVYLDEVHTPEFILPFVARVSAVWGVTIQLRSEGATAIVDQNRASMDGEWSAVGAVEISPAKNEVEKAHDLFSRGSPSMSTIAGLNKFAHKTYAPATEASRLKGAGAGVSDND